jgi:hypothetical protein
LGAALSSAIVKVQSSMRRGYVVFMQLKAASLRGLICYLPKAAGLLCASPADACDVADPSEAFNLMLLDLPVHLQLKKRPPSPCHQNGRQSQPTVNTNNYGRRAIRSLLSIRSMRVMSASLAPLARERG